MPSRKLTLRRESLSGLASDDLEAVAGGASVSPTCGPTCPLRCLVAYNPSLLTCPATACTPCPL